MDYVDVFALVIVYSQSTAVVSTHPTATVCNDQRTAFLQQVLPLKPGAACLRDRRYFVGEFEFKNLDK